MRPIAGRPPAALRSDGSTAEPLWPGMPGRRREDRYADSEAMDAKGGFRVILLIALFSTSVLVSREVDAFAPPPCDPEDCVDGRAWSRSSHGCWIASRGSCQATSTWRTRSTGWPPGSDSSPRMGPSSGFGSRERADWPTASGAPHRGSRRPSLHLPVATCGRIRKLRHCLRPRSGRMTGAGDGTSLQGRTFASAGSISPGDAAPDTPLRPALDRGRSGGPSGGRRDLSEARRRRSDPAAGPTP